MAGWTKSEFEHEYRTLLAEFGDQSGQGGCIRCVDCKGCIESTFCRLSEGLVRCHYCERCASCTDSTRCRDSKNLFSCSHCVACEACVRCSYSIRSMRLVDCNYCFGCVGLSRKDFHILNEPYEREEYFRLVRELGRTLGGEAQWRPRGGPH